MVAGTTANASEKLKMYGVEISIASHLGSDPTRTWKPECVLIMSLRAAAFGHELQRLPKINIVFVSWNSPCGEK